MLLTAWITVVTAALLVAPGAGVARRMGVPWPVSVAVGPPVTFAIVSLATVIYGKIGFEWNIITAAIAVVAALVVAWGYARFVNSQLGRRVLPAAARDEEVEAVSVRSYWPVAAGLIIGAVMIVTTAVRPLVNTAFAGLNNVSQVWDSLWHASSLRWIHETGVGSSLRMGELMNYDTHGFNFYPNTWHALGALLFPVTGANPVELYNVYSPAVLAITVPISVAAFAYWLARHRLSVAESTAIGGVGGAIAGLFPSLPYVELELTAVPNAVGVSMAPVVAVLVISVVRDRRRIGPAAVAVAGVTATHPSGLVVLGVIVGLWWLTEGLWHPTPGRASALRRRFSDTAALAAAGIGALILSAPIIYGTIKIAGKNELSGFDFRDESTSVGKALAQGLFNYTIPLDVIGPVWALAVLSIIGLGVLVWLRCWGMLTAWLVFVLVAANSVVALGPLSDLLGILGGYFYNSGHRLTFVTALFAASATAVAAGGISIVVARLLAVRTDAKTGTKPFARKALPVTLCLVLILIIGGGVLRYPPNAQTATKERGGSLVGPDDLAAYHWLSAQPDTKKALILNNLDQGTGWLYPVTGLTPLFPFYRANDFSQRQRDLYWGVDKLGADPYIDSIARDMNVRYVIDSPPSYWWFQNGVPDPEHGRQGDPFLAVRTDGASGLDPVFHRGNVTVYRVNDKVFSQ